MNALSKGFKAYQQDSVKTKLASADPHRVIQMLMEGALQRMAEGKGAIDRNDMELKSVSLSKAQAIIRALLESVDVSTESEVANNLVSLYEFMINLITDAMVNHQVEPLDEASELLVVIKSGWDQISDEDKQKGYALREQAGPL